jgi:H+/Cl- antiporter ClcA
MIATIVRWLVLAIVTGLIVGSGTSLFLTGLFYFSARTADVSLWAQMAFLPTGGILNGLLLYYGYRNSKNGAKDSVIKAIHTKSGIMPRSTILVKPIAALITLTSGGSAGKEGPCAHIGGSLASWFGQMIRLEPETQKRMVACGVSAGFASVFGTPLAGAIYGVEMLAIGRVRHDFIFPAIIAAIVSVQVSKFWGISYDSFPVSVAASFSSSLFIRVVLIGVLCGLVSLLFIESIAKFRLLFSFIQRRLNLWQPLMPFIGGLVLAALIVVIPTDYLGLSLPLMSNALQGNHVDFLGFAWKSLLVAITLGSGFYGGIVTPQFVVGALAGNAFGHLLGVNAAFGAAIGMISVVAASSNTPIAAVLMGFELYGNSAAIYFASACVTAYIVVGHRSVYTDQVLAYSKSLWLRHAPDEALNPGQIQISYSLLRKTQYFRRRKSDRKPSVGSEA